MRRNKLKFYFSRSNEVYIQETGNDLFLDIYTLLFNIKLQFESKP
jgi:hypothetical protein